MAFCLYAGFICKYLCIRLLFILQSYSLCLNWMLFRKVTLLCMHEFQWLCHLLICKSWNVIFCNWLIQPFYWSKTTTNDVWFAQWLQMTCKTTMKMVMTFCFTSRVPSPGPQVSNKWNNCIICHDGARLVKKICSYTLLEEKHRLGIYKGGIIFYRKGGTTVCVWGARFLGMA